MNGRASRPEVSELIKSNHKIHINKRQSYVFLGKIALHIEKIWHLMKHMHTSGAKEHHHRRTFEQNSDILRTGHF